MSQDVEVVLVQTHLIQPGEDVAAAVRRYLAPLARPGDIGFVSEKIVAIGQRRCVPAASVRPRRLARLLSRFVARNPAGMGLRRPVVMEMALREVGAPRILAASLVGAAGRLIGRRGLFYAVAGRQVAAIDGPNPYTIRPYAFYVVLAPRDVAQAVRRLERAAGIPMAVVDANDLGVEVLGASPGVDPTLVRRALAGNPMGQEGQRTPMGLIRRRA